MVKIIWICFRYGIVIGDIDRLVFYCSNFGLANIETSNFGQSSIVYSSWTQREWYGKRRQTWGSVLKRFQSYRLFCSGCRIAWPYISCCIFISCCLDTSLVRIEYWRSCYFMWWVIIYDTYEFNLRKSTAYE